MEAIWTEGLAGRHVVVTGAGRGLGRAIAIAFASLDATVTAVARSSTDLDSLAANGDGRIDAWCCDVTTDAFVDRLEALGQLDVLVNNAGMNRPLPIEAVDGETLDAMLMLNIRSVYRASQAAVRVMSRGGRGGSIIQMSSQMGHVGAPNRTVYCMTKHAVEGLTKAMAVELGPIGIRVNSVAPTFIETDLTQKMLADEAFRISVLSSIPLGRVGTPADVVGAVIFLASPAAAMITGSSIRVDGGWTAR